MTKLILLAAVFGIILNAKEIHKTFPLTADGHVHVDTYKGEVHVTSWDKPEVEVSVRIEPDGSSTADLELVDRTDIRMDSTSGSLHLKTDYPHWDHHLRNLSLPFARYQIRMPRTARLEIKDYKSEIDVTAIDASIDINTYKGHGTFEFAKFAGPSSIETYKGSFDISVPASSGFDLVSRNSGRQSVHSAFSYTIPAGTYNGGYNGHFTARINGGGPELVLKSYRGEFNLH